MGADKQLSRWAEHFEEFLNRPAPANTPDIPAAEEDLPSDCGKPTREEIRKAIKQLKNGKAAGTDEIPAEVLKVHVDPEMLAEMLYGLFEKIWEEEEIPSEWKEGLLIKISPRKETLACVQIIEDHTPVYARESVEQSHPGKVERAGTSQPPGSASRLQARQVMYRPDLNTTNYSGTIN